MPSAKTGLLQSYGSPFETEAKVVRLIINQTLKHIEKIVVAGKRLCVIGVMPIVKHINFPYREYVKLKSTLMLSVLKKT